MTRRSWLWLVVALMGAALAATFVFDSEPEGPPAPSGPAATPFGWTAQLQLSAGDGVHGLRDGPALQARFADPYGLAVAADGTRYIADAGDNNRIRKIAPDGTVSTLAGGAEGFADGIGEAAALHTPSGLALDAFGNLYVADTGNHAIRKITPQGAVTTLAGTGQAGFNDGPGAQAQFNGPIGVAVDASGQVYVADTYNDRIRAIAPDGQVSTLAGGERPGYQDGTGSVARFDTPTGLALDAQGRLWIADTRNNAIRRLSRSGEVTTLLRAEPGDRQPLLRRPLSLAVSHDGMLYVGEMARGRVLQLAPDGRWHVLTGGVQEQRLARPSGLALDADGVVHVTDASSYRVHRIAPLAAGAAGAAATVGPAADNPLPDTQGRWPLRPQTGWHEVVGTLGEVRGNYQRENRDHLHSGLDIRGDVGAEVLAIADGKVSSPSASWGLGELGEGMAVDTLSYIHMRVGRTAQGRVIDPQRFHLLHDEDGKPERIRVLRGTRFAAGDVLGTINPLAHVHLSVGAAGFERNAVALGFVNYADSYPPRIDGIQLLDVQEQPLSLKRDGRLIVPRDPAGVQIVVDAWDQVDRNLRRRRLGLHALGYQILDADEVPLPGYETPRMTIEFNRMPADADAVKIAYGPGSGVTVHGSAITRFQYLVTNTVRDGQLATGRWQPGELPAGDYTLRITARDYSGNVASAGRDLPMTLQ
ncbi:gluconolaconase [Pseudoxanthomonas wuyuanensis]|uniref:NHL repeat-containing protein n=1 Tax=Pseudoxanthomonas wuyuanensis TaxID=1073196 RepID=A0A286DBD5_9GAMM|nr:gluconolaconase [Pseudoxanthomonas wuyuanensis]KAF1721759.1 gluconolaconase [Pseudoxanthomonas wuyuanensis]SOD55949.1 NHL repeat-containing protein [Pseudoxanthomonas wuyuanensis]